MVKKKSKQKAGSNTIALNKKARHEYFIDDEIEARLGATRLGSESTSPR